MRGAWILLAMVGSPEPEPPTADEAERAGAEEPAKIENAVVFTLGLDDEVLRRALELRAAQLSTHDHRAGAFKPGADELYAFVDVRPHPEAGYSLTIILSDGRAYDRHVEVAGEHAARAVATAVGNLLSAIEEDRVEPDRGDVPLPPPEPAVDDKPEPPEEELGPEPEPEPEAPPKPEPERLPFELGVPIYGPLILGLGPPSEPGVLAALGVGLGLDARFPQGAIVGIDARVAGQRAGVFRLTRTRVAVTGGYDLRRGAFELDARLRLGFEPWRVVAGGQDQRVESVDDGSLAPGTLVLAAVSATPGIRLQAGSVALRLGVWTELALGGVIDGGLGAAHIHAAVVGEDPVSLFRMGGAELGLGLQLGAWFGLPRRAPRQ